MDIFQKSDDRLKCNGTEAIEPGEPGPEDLYVQLVITVLMGSTAFLGFCFLRPRWKSLYAARKRHLDPAIGLPPLPDTFFGWMPALYRITEEQVLSCGGLDAYVFLSFFKMSMRLFVILLFFASAVLAPIHHRFKQEWGTPGNGTNTSAYYVSPRYPLASIGYRYQSPAQLPLTALADADGPGDDNSWNPDMGYLWAYLVFTYFFTFLTIWFVNSETFKIIRIRQEYLGTQSTITDRTFRVTGIPNELRSEDGIKQLVEKLEIGKVESVTLCRNWEELDALVAERAGVLQKLERAWAKYLKQTPTLNLSHSRSRNGTNQAGTGNPENNGDYDEEAAAGAAAGENGRLLSGEERQQGGAPHQLVERERPTARIWYGFLGLQSRKADAIDYFEERLQRLDGKIQAARKKKYETADLAFVTMDSIAACQMAIQALLDPRPGQLLTKLAPAPSDVVWHNTYAPRSARRVRSWAITLFIGGLSIIWLVPVASLATLLSLCTIEQWWPGLSAWLSVHETVKALVQTGLTTGLVSLLNVAVPFLYDYLARKQGSLSRGDVELSIISKNFFFNFFNIFLVFTVFGTASNFWTVLQDNIRDLTWLASHLATAIQRLNIFYINFIMLQGLGLFPVRLLEFGAVFLYPFSRFLASTPRERSLVDQPPVFSYGFYLPTALLVFILCLVYSVLPGGYLVLLLGLVYFCLGYFTYKYQLLYAMDAPRHATGGAWRIICYRVILGLLIFQLAMSGILALRTAFVTAILVVPLLVVTVWYSYYFRRRFEPLTKYISLRSIRREEERGEQAVEEAEEDLAGEDERRVEGELLHEEVAEAGRLRGLLRRMSTVDEDRERGSRFINPSLIVPLEQPWIYDEPPPLIPQQSDAESDSEDRYRDYEDLEEHRPTLDPGIPGAAPSGSTSSSLSLGDTHIWRDS